MRRHYTKEDSNFRRLVNTNTNINFRPRFHLFYTEREAEQDAYFWFQQGQILARQQMIDEQDSRIRRRQT